MAKVKKATTAAKNVTTGSPVAAAIAPRRGVAKKAAPASAVTVSPEERIRMIEQVAYFRAEKVGFTGDPQEHWTGAEVEVDAILASKKANKK